MQTTTYSEILSQINRFEFIIIDQKILDLYPAILEIVEKKVFYSLKYPEQSKNITEYSKIINYFLENNVTRNSSFLAIGGGATSDLAGFVASTILRGIGWSVIPTSLLAMIDAGIGGKVGINSNLGKNLIGAFHLPKDVFICTKFLETLPEIELVSGQGELLKYTILSKEIYDELLKNGFSDKSISLCVDFKMSIVEEDFKEGGKRKLLNLGHTFGHAIEKSLGLPHGIAVYYGLIFILELYAPDLLNRLLEIVKIQNIHISKIEKINLEKFASYLEVDKKRISPGKIEFIIPKEIGEIEILSKDIPSVLTALKEHKIYKQYFT